ncbi:hypothetical protein M885DRAFT_541879 [Pelagophyceae sp. CCMP2097]|nr:hypothetical protein M885DRAFT_541879 [Pelagophyceae sp. CCMP2097]
MGAAATAHREGVKFKEAIPSVEEVLQDSMHQQSRVARTQQKNHADHGEATRQLKLRFRAVSEGAYDEVKTTVCHKRIGDLGGLVVKKSSTGRPRSTKLLIGLCPRKYLELRDKDGQCAMSGTKFDEHYFFRESAQRGAFDYTDHTEATTRLCLGDTYRWSAGELAPPCGTCGGCLPGEPTGQEITAAKAVRSATNRLAALQCRRHKALVAASEEAPVPAATPHREHDDRVDDDRSICLRAKRVGRFDGKGQLLNSCDAKRAFEADSRNAKYMQWPQYLCPRQRPIIQDDGKQKCNAVGMPLSYLQGGTSAAENAFGRAERVLSAKGGYTVGYASLLGSEFVSRSNTAARRGYLGEPDVGHNKLYLLEQIDENYEAIGEPKTGKPVCPQPRRSSQTGSNLERASDKTLPCPCPRTVTARRTMRDRQHPIHYCLHGITPRLQQTRGGGARRGKARRDRRG